MPTLTKRQCAILWCMAAGLPMPEIAARLKVSLSTVGGHRSQLARIYGSNNIVSLLRAAVADGQIPANVLGRPVPSLLRKVVP